MNDLEKGFIHIDDNNNVSYMSYDTAGVGMFMIGLLILATVFITKISTYVTNNKWVVVIPALLAVIIRLKIFNSKIPKYKKVLFVISDLIKTICMYGVLIIILDKIATVHWLDRLLYAVLYGAIFIVVYYLLSKWIFTMLRVCEICSLYMVASLIIAFISLFIYFNHTWYWMGYNYKTFFNTATIVEIDERMEGEIEIPENINSYTVTKIGKDAFSSNDKITAVKLPNTIETIEKHAFSWCDSLNSIVIPLSIKTIEEDAFYSTHALTDIYYNGTADDWNKVYNQKNSTNEVNIHFNE